MYCEKLRLSSLLTHLKMKKCSLHKIGTQYPSAEIKNLCSSVTGQMDLFL
jgi:hypothetical protein